MRVAGGVGVKTDNLAARVNARASGADAFGIIDILNFASGNHHAVRLPIGGHVASYGYTRIVDARELRLLVARHFDRA